MKDTQDSTKLDAAVRACAQDAVRDLLRDILGQLNKSADVAEQRVAARAPKAHRVRKNGAPAEKRKGPGRPKGSKNRPKVEAQAVAA